MTKQTRSGEPADTTAADSAAADSAVTDRAHWEHSGNVSILRMHGAVAGRTEASVTMDGVTVTAISFNGRRKQFRHRAGAEAIQAAGTWLEEEGRDLAPLTALDALRELLIHPHKMAADIGKSEQTIYRWMRDGTLTTWQLEEGGTQYVVKDLLYLDRKG